MLVNPRILFDHCYGNYGIAAVNVWSMEQILALFSAGERAGAPFIVQTTPAARNYAGPGILLSLIAAAGKKYPGNVYAVHLDHGNESHIDEAMRTGGYSSVMIDASHDSFEENIKRTSTVVEKAHQQNLDVEAELGVLAGIEDDIASSKTKYTKPAEVEEFIHRTSCDSLAIAVGTSHGAYKFSGGDGIQFDILNEIRTRLPGFPLVLHGGSEINISEIMRINKSGGRIGEDAKGVPTDQLQKAIKHGICKINIATDARLIWTRVHREFFIQDPTQIDPVIPGKTFMLEFEKFLLEKFEVLGSVGKNQFIKLPGK